MTHKIVIVMLLAAIGLGIVALAWRGARDAVPAPPVGANTQLLIPPHAQALETIHYRIHYTGTRQQAELVASVVEKLYTAYTSVFAQPPQSTAPGKLTLVLFRDQAEFKENNRSSSWAEAYYLQPACYAYFSQGANPFHWMTHEATHQLAREVSGFRRNRWIDEGLASYFAASAVGEAGLQLGVVDSSAYPIWWVLNYRLSGDAATDTAAARFLPLEVLLTGRGGPDVDSNFNLYYVDAWSLTHFLFHYDDGKYAKGYAQFLAQGSKPEDFAPLIGPLERVQKEWYQYLLELQRLR